MPTFPNFCLRPFLRVQWVVRIRNDVPDDVRALLALKWMLEAAVPCMLFPEFSTCVALAPLVPKKHDMSGRKKSIGVPFKKIILLITLC